MIGRKGIYICVIDSINIIYKTIVKHFLLFLTNLAIYKDWVYIIYPIYKHWVYSRRSLPKGLLLIYFFQIITNDIS